MCKWSIIQMNSFDTVLLLDTLTSETANLNYEQSQSLYKKISLEYLDEKSKYKRFLKVKTNPYFNALQVKYSYVLPATSSMSG